MSKQTKKLQISQASLAYSTDATSLRAFNIKRLELILASLDLMATNIWRGLPITAVQCFASAAVTDGREARPHFLNSVARRLNKSSQAW